MCPAGRVRCKTGEGRPGGRPLHTSIVKRSVGGDAHIAPVAPALKKSVGRRLDAPPLPTRTITAGWGHPAPARARGEAPLGGRCKKRERRGRSLFSLLFSPGQQSLAPAGMESSSSSRCSFSSPFSLCTAEMSMPQEGMPIIFRAGRFKMATAVLPTSSSGS